MISRWRYHVLEFKRNSKADDSNEIFFSCVFPPLKHLFIVLALKGAKQYWDNLNNPYFVFFVNSSHTYTWYLDMWKICKEFSLSFKILEQVRLCVFCTNKVQSKVFGASCRLDWQAQWCWKEKYHCKRKKRLQEDSNDDLMIDLMTRSHSHVKIIIVSSSR